MIHPDCLHILQPSPLQNGQVAATSKDGSVKA
jgi:hypothetical protein